MLARTGLKYGTKGNSKVLSTFVRNKITLPDLDWDFGDLEPYISGQINEIHYKKHHQAYVDGFNTNTEKVLELNEELKKDPSPKIVREILGLQHNIRFHGGGFTNHCLFWKNLTPEKEGGGHLSKDTGLSEAIKKQFGSKDELIKLTNEKLAGIQGSGWAFIVKNLENGGKLEVVQRYNQDTVTGRLIPLVAIDAWEHAYYLQYQNKKVDYFKAIWNVINWEEAAKRYDNETINIS
ncbi:hypothetical protein KAFR_0C05730 [Kazachstania africana CBS 2517]|uniref:Superoxide dismutase n=1 Tax=Kazachstania africana (strain ATCC 22294 / BCRC 22015 / CBS 2517 / CECT 1963 / NBRC 1671 / NRRL Y-8276) TaxID=1071382 RepID=H2AT64_KAZAF|nr:hypothetical protein KAFR_0C05730 [Kazachstania africana CBS 2517]CCF57564.1 hypothetical protein KAFR_0C05730 [Kazachstania africana CBS 2517]